MICGGMIDDIPTCQKLVQKGVGDAKKTINDRLVSIVADGGADTSTAA